METHPPTTPSTFETCVRHRHSIRSYTSTDVPDSILHDSIALAQLAPSNSNIQNWRLHLARGAARDRIVTALKHEASTSPSSLAPLPEQFKPFRSELGHRLYGPEGYDIKREQKTLHDQLSFRNYEFFGAPVAGVVTMHKALGQPDALSVGMFLQTFVLALTDRGVGCCLQASVAGYPEVLAREFRIPEDQVVLCGIAIGWPKPGSKVNSVVMSREDAAASYTLLEE